MTIFLCIIGASLAVVGDVAFKRWAAEGSVAMLLGGIALYSVDACVWAIILKRGVMLSTGAVAWSATGLLLAFAAGCTLFAERPNLRQMGGAILVLLGLCLSSCTKTVETRSESAFQAAQQEETKKAETLTETVQTGPSTTTVYRFAPPEKEEDCAGLARCGASVLPSPSPSLSHPFGPAFRPHRVTTNHPDEAPAQPRIDGLPAHGPLVEMTVTQTGPILDTRRQTDKEASSATQTVNAEARVATVAKTSYWPPWWLWGALAALLAAGYLAWRGLRIASL